MRVNFDSNKTEEQKALAQKYVFIDRMMLINLINRKKKISTLAFKSNIKHIDNTIDKTKIVGYDTSVDIDDITENIVYAIYKPSGVEIISDKQIAVTYGKKLFTSLELDNLDISELELVNCISADEMFEGTVIKKNFNIGNKDFSSVTSANRMFNEAILPKLDLSNADFSNLLNAICMFGLQTKELKLPKNFSELQYLDGIFDGLMVDSSLDLSNTDFSKAKSAKSMFASAHIEGALNLRNANFSRLEDAKEMFRESDIQELDLTESKFDSLLIADSMFKEAEIANLRLADNMFNKVKLLFATFEESIIPNIDLSKQDLSQVVGMRGAFMKCETDEIKLPNIDSVTDLTRTFFRAIIEHKINIGNINFSSVQTADDCFAECRIPEIDICNKDLTQLNTVENKFMFRGANIKILNLTNSKLCKTINDSMLTAHVEEIYR